MGLSIGAVLGIGEGLVSGGASLFEGSARANALEQRERQEEVATSSRKLLQGQQLNRILAQQNVAASASGTTLASPSFMALQRKSFNAFSQDANADNLNLSFQKDALEQQKRNALTEGFLQAGTSAFGIANDFRNLRVPGVGGSQTNAQGNSFQNEFNRETNPFPEF